MLNKLRERINSWSGRKKIFALVLFIGALAVVWRFTIGKPDEDTAKLPPVKADPRVISEGIVVPVKYGALSLPVAGVVAELLVGEGEKVQPGQPLVRLVNDDLAARASAARADMLRTQAKYSEVVAGSRPQEIAMKRAQVQQSFAACELARADLDRMEKLYSQQAVSRQEYEKTSTAYTRARSDWEHAKADYELMVAGSRPETVAAAEAEFTAASATYNQAVSLTAQTELKAPFAGSVAYLDHKIGEYVGPGVALVQLGDMSSWRVKTDDLTEIQIARVREGAKVTMTFDGLPDLELTGKVAAIRAFGEKKRGDITYTVFIEPDRHEPLLKWNMTAIVKIETE